MANINTAPRDGVVLIIGAGISGICTAIDLIRHNKTRNFIIVEKSTQVGGTWNDSRYPGCCCDGKTPTSKFIYLLPASYLTTAVWSHLYSLSFEQNPAWSREYASQAEIHQYLIGVAEKWGLFRHIRFNTEVEEARWSETENQWKVAVKIGGGKEGEFHRSYTIACDYLVSGVGQLNYPHYPNIQGLSDFKGKIMHSARWDTEYKLEGKRVAIIGNGSTAAQIIPEVAKVCKSLTVFQRTPNWVVPRNDAPISSTMQSVYRYVPALRRRLRAKLMDVRESFFKVVVLENDDEKDALKKQCLAIMQRALPDKPELREKLTPKYPPGCKRVMISDDFFPAFNLSHVALEMGAIHRISEKGIVVDGKELEFDLIILATGFRTLEFMYPIKVYGLGGRSIEDIWRAGPRAYLGMTVESVPNFAMLYGPNTNLGHNSIILVIEAQSRYITTLISAVLNTRSRGQTLTMIPSQQTVDAFNSHIQGRLQVSTFADTRCHSYFKNDDGLIVTQWPGTAIEYQERLSTVNWKDYQFFGSGASAMSTKKRSELGRVVEETTLAMQYQLLSAATVAAVVVWGMTVKAPALFTLFK